MLQRSFGLTMLGIAAAALLVSGCSSTKKSAPVEETVQQEPAVYEPQEPVVSEPVYQGPEAGSQEDLQQAAGDMVFFGFDRYDLSAEARATLEAQARWMAQNPSVDLIIEGHCDERGTREYNLALGERRATAAKNYLVALGVSSGRLETVSYGKERPMVLGNDAEAWAKNRRALSRVK